TLSGANTYSGGTTISAGTLALGASSVLPNGTTVNLAGGTLAMSSYNNTVSALQFSGSGKAKGTWGSTSSAADHRTSSIAGSGILTVTTGGISSTTLASSANPSTYGGSVTFTATVTGSGGNGSTPSGTVTFKDGSTTLGTGSLSGSGTTATATFTTNNLTHLASPFSITASWLGDENYDASISSALAQVVNAKALTAQGSLSYSGKVYDRTTNATPSGSAALQAPEALGVGTTSDGKPYSVDSVSLTGTAGWAYNSKDVATATTVTGSGLSLTGTGSGNYTLTAPTLSAMITQRALTVTNAVVPTRIYDGTINATITGATLSGVISGDTVTLNGQGYFDVGFSDVVAGTNLTVISEMYLGGSDSANYSLTQPTLTGTITPKALTVTGLTAGARVYNGTTNETLGGSAVFPAAEDAGAGSTSDGKPYNVDYVSAGGTAVGAFADKNVGTAKPVLVTGVTVTGYGAGNYTVSEQTGLTADVTAVAITVTATTCTKTYDGTNSAAGTPTITSGAIQPGDTGPAWTQTYDTKDVGTGKTLTPAGKVIDGNSGNNYNYTYGTVASGVINPLSLTVTGLTAQDKAYDGTTNAMIVGTGTLVSVISPDVVSLEGTPVGHFVDAAIGTGKTVTVTGLSLGGADAIEYSLTPPTLTASITNGVIYSETNVILSIADLGGGSFTLYFQGTEGAKYYVVKSSDVTAAMSAWTVVGVTNTAGAGGLWNETVSEAAPVFYRGAAVDPKP
ncbi:MAG: YDG domain-containing protein, partial [Verrucomicrobiae bacterium]